MIIDLQRRLAEIGRIRIGQQVATGNGRSRPAKLATFRLTSADRVRIDHAAALYGGQPQQWQAPAGPQWELITKTADLDVIVPPSDMAFSQHYELWSKGGCQRRCDGRLEAITEGPCLCDPAARECDIHTRLSVLLRDLPGLGVWRIDTSGYYAAVELQGAVEVIQLAAGRGEMLPARLRLEQRQVKRTVDGKAQTRNFAVPVLDIEVSPGQLMASPRAQITAGESTPQVDGAARLTPVPAELPSGPVRTVAEQAAQVEGDPPPRRRSSAQPLPETGLRPRTAAEAAADEPAIEGIRPAQVKKLGVLMREAGITARQDALDYVMSVIGRDVASRNELTKDEASRVIDALERLAQTDDGAAAPAAVPPQPGGIPSAAPSSPELEYEQQEQS